jgi:hypothetical protein
MDNSSQDSRYKILTLATCTPFKVPAFQRQPDRKHRVWSIINIPLKHQRLVTPKPVAQLLHLFPYAMLKVLWSSQLRLAALRVLCAASCGVWLLTCFSHDCARNRETAAAAVVAAPAGLLDGNLGALGGGGGACGWRHVGSGGS